MSVPSYPFHSLLLKPPNKGSEEYSKMIIFIPFHYIPSSQAKPKASFERREWNGMERNEKNNLEYSSLSFPCLGVLMKGIESLFPYLGV